MKLKHPNGTDIHGEPIPNPAIFEFHRGYLVKVGNRKRWLEVAVVRDGVIVAAFPDEKFAQEYIDTPRRSPLSQETVDEIRDRIESYQTVKEWGLADWCNEARKSTQLLFDILAEIEGKQS